MPRMQPQASAFVVDRSVNSISELFHEVLEESFREVFEV